MMEHLLISLTLCAAVGCGISGGVFFAFSTFVMKGLTRLPAGQGIAAMNAINVTAPSPPFMTALFGTGLLCVILGVHGLLLLQWDRPGASYYIVAGSLLYLAGTITVTMVFNVPRNNALAQLDPGNATHAVEAWKDYVDGWSAWNHVRTILSTGAGPQGRDSKSRAG